MNNRNRRRTELKRNRHSSPSGPAPLRAARSVAEIFAEANRLSKIGKTAEAERLCQAALAAHPDHAYSLLLNGIAARRSGRNAEAVELLTRAAETGDRDVDFHNNLGNALADVGLYPAARAQYERALKLKPDSAEVQYNLGNVQAILQDFGSAVASYESAVALKPDYVDAHVNLGNLLAQLDRAEQAMAHFKSAIAIQPRNAKAHNNVGFILNTLGRYDEAKTHLERALALSPRYPHAQNNLGNVHLAQGSAERAITHYRAALAIEPDYVNAINNLANALCQLHRYDEARVHLERALALAPQSAPVNNGLGNALQKLGRLSDAVACYERAIAVDANYAEAWTNLGAVYNEQELHEKAIVCCDRALASDPRSTEALNNRGIALVALDRFDEAMESYNKVLAIDPSLADVLCNIGSALVEQGRTDEALGYFDQAIALEPHRPKFQLCHVLTRRVTEGDERLAKLEALVRDPAATSNEARIDLHFGLAKAYADVGRHDESFAEFLIGNALKRTTVAYDEAATIGYLDRFAQVWPGHQLDVGNGTGHSSERPIFILGMPRSGSTLVEQILASHPMVAAGGELRIFEASAISVLGPLETFSPERWPAEARAGQLREIAERYLTALDVHGRGAMRITDKTLGNFAYIGLVKLTFPNARIIHTRRNPLDTCLSCFSSLFTSVPFSYDLGEVGRYYRAYDRLMRHWSSVVPKSAMLDVDYETLVSDFETEARKIIAYCGLPWDDACMSFHTTKRRVKTASAMQVRQPLYKTSVDRWRAIAPELLRPLRDALGDLDRSEQ